MMLIVLSIALCLLLLCLIFVIRGKNNLHWWQFISSKGSDGKHYADIDKLGKVTGIIISSWIVVRVSDNTPFDFTGFSLILGTYLAFVGGVAGYSAYLRSKKTKE